MAEMYYAIRCNDSFSGRVNKIYLNEKQNKNFISAEPMNNDRNMTSENPDCQQHA